MSDHIKQTINDLESKLKPAEDEVRKLKTMINQLCEMAGMAARHRVDAEESTAAVPTEIGSDQFYGQPLATCVRTYLEIRQASGGERTATVAEIYEALCEGGYKFESKNADYAKRGLRQSLTKNPTAFHKLPNGRYGLTSWYPNAKTPRAADGASASASAAESQDQSNAETPKPGSTESKAKAKANDDDDDDDDEAAEELFE
ncbi:MAG: hypothetical protein KAI24_07260 [Planctomycetes bacterium]|nr:hypothetical protein [Planctomycetota bacterium]